MGQPTTNSRGNFRGVLLHKFTWEKIYDVQTFVNRKTAASFQLNIENNECYVLCRANLVVAIW